MNNELVEAIEHVAIAVQDIATAVQRYRELGFTNVRVEDIPGDIRSHVLRSGTAYIELLESTSSGSALQQFLERKGEGLHHLCLQVDSLAAASKAVEIAGCSLISTSPVTDIRGRRVFVHPASNDGVLIGLVEVTKPSVQRDHR